MILADVGDHDFHTRAGEDLRHAEPDAAGAARDESGLSFDDLHRTMPPDRPLVAAAVAELPAPIAMLLHQSRTKSRCCRKRPAGSVGAPADAC